MTTRNLVAFTIAIAGIFLLFGCSDESPVSSSSTEQFVTESLAQAAPGSYQLSFLASSGQPVSSLPVNRELVLHASVQDSNGVSAQRGAVKFQFCSRRGGLSLQRDCLPKIECQSGGTGVWVLVTTMKVDAGTCPGLGSGNACVIFGLLSSPRTVGFRFEYTSQGSGIANGMSPALDFSWL